MGNCRNTLRNVARKQSGGGVRQAIAGSLLSINCTLGNGYPYCSGRSAIAGYNNLFTMRPDLAEEWGYDKNQEIRPDQLAVNAHNRT